MRTQPPRLVHAVQRSVQLSVTSNVMQITVIAAVDWAVDISAPYMMQAAFRATTAARRVPGPDGRRSRAGRATWGWLGARHHSVTPARSPRSPGARGKAVPPLREPHTGSWRATGPGCGLWGPIVMPLSSPRYIPRTWVRRKPVRRSGQEEGVGHLGGRRPGSPVPVAHRAHLSRRGPMARVTSSSSAFAGSFRTPLRSGAAWPGASFRGSTNVSC
jgi:hypothetical protein